MDTYATLQYGHNTSNSTVNWKYFIHIRNHKIITKDHNDANDDNTSSSQSGEVQMIWEENILPSSET